MSKSAGAEAKGDTKTPSDLDPASDGGDDQDLEGQLWEQQQQLEEASLYADQLQQKVGTARTSRLNVRVELRGPPQLGARRQQVAARGLEGVGKA